MCASVYVSVSAMSKCVSVCASSCCICHSESPKVCMIVCGCVFERASVRVRVCVCQGESEGMCMCVYVCRVFPLM